jgi:predicted transcriptional regulator
MSDDSHDHSFARSQADLMAGVAGVFFVLMAVFVLRVNENTKKTREQLARLQEQDNGEASAERAVANSLAAIAEQLKTLTNELASSNAGILVEPDEARQELTINLDPSGKIFDYGLGKDELECKNVDSAVRVLTDTIRIVCRNLYQPTQDNTRQVRMIHRIVLEGHTDNSAMSNDKFALSSCPGTRAEKTAESITYGREFGANVALSGRRAVNVVRLATESRGLAPEERQCIENFFLISGRGPVDPISIGGASPSAGTPWRTHQVRGVDDRNRRVVLRVEGRQDIKRLARELQPD